MALVCTDSGGRDGRQRSTWFAHAVYELQHIPPTQIFNLYRRRTGIESGYRQLDQVRAHTRSHSPALRQHWLTGRRYAQRVRSLWLTLRRFTLYLSRLLEQLDGVRPLVQSVRAQT